MFEDREFGNGEIWRKIIYSRSEDEVYLLIGDALPPFKGRSRASLTSIKSIIQWVVESEKIRKASTKQTE